MILMLLQYPETHFYLFDHIYMSILSNRIITLYVTFFQSFFPHFAWLHNCNYFDIYAFGIAVVAPFMQPTILMCEDRFL